jgi:hypothetical protein
MTLNTGLLLGTILSAEEKEMRGRQIFEIVVSFPTYGENTGEAKFDTNYGKLVTDLSSRVFPGDLVVVTYALNVIRYQKDGESRSFLKQDLKGVTLVHRPEQPQTEHDLSGESPVPF